VPFLTTLTCRQAGQAGTKTPRFYNKFFLCDLGACLCALCVLLFPNRIERKGIRKRYARRELSEMFYPRLSAVDYIP